MRAKREADAAREFRAAIPLLMAAGTRECPITTIRRRPRRAANGCRISSRPTSACSSEAQTDDRRRQRRRRDLLPGRCRPRPVGAATRWRHSSARMLIKDTALAELIRKEQDLDQADECAARHAQQRAGLAVRPSAMKTASRRINAAIEQDAQRAQRRCASEIARQFPSYANLIDPQAADRSTRSKPRYEPGRGPALVLFRPRRQLRVGRAEGRAGGVRADSCVLPGRSRPRCDKLRKSLEAGRRR